MAVFIGNQSEKNRDEREEIKTRGGGGGGERCVGRSDE